MNLAMSEVLEFYEEVVDEEFVEELLHGAEVKSRHGLYSASVVVWLIIFQRLSADRTLETAVTELQGGVSGRLLKRANRSSRAHKKSISSGTGALSQARSRLPELVVEEIADRIEGAICSRQKEQTFEGRKVFVVDGTTVRLSHTEANIASYPQHKNQHQKAHFPLLKVLVATDAVTGVCTRPAMGPTNGKDATSELRLAETLLPQLEAGSVVIGDRFFGCLRFVQHATKAGCYAICRMKESNIRKFIGKPKSTCGEVTMTWSASPHEEKKYGATESIPGRFIWYKLERNGFKPQELFFFTTLDWPIEKIVEAYGLRWRVESDLRDLKTTLQMESIAAKTPEMIRKEVILGVTAYNMIKHLMGITAIAMKVKPRELSFSSFLRKIRALGNGLLSSEITHVNEEDVVNSIILSPDRALLLPKRKKQRPSEPRKVWGKGRKDFMTQPRQVERDKLTK